MSSEHRWRRVGSIITLAALGALPGFSLSADAVDLTIEPDKCISLRKGQTCYQRVQFNWQSINQTETQKIICLWREGDAVALNCWSNASEGKFRYNLEAKQSTSFYLVSGEEQQPVIARTELKINWVYNSRSTGRIRWRIF